MEPIAPHLPLASSSLTLTPWQLGKLALASEQAQGELAQAKKMHAAALKALEDTDAYHREDRRRAVAAIELQLPGAVERAKRARRELEEGLRVAAGEGDARTREAQLARYTQEAQQALERMTRAFHNLRAEFDAVNTEVLRGSFADEAMVDKRKKVRTVLERAWKFVQVLRAAVKTIDQGRALTHPFGMRAVAPAMAGAVGATVLHARHVAAPTKLSPAVRPQERGFGRLFG